MAVTTEEVWLIDGRPLNTLAWNITTIEGRESIPTAPGDNVRMLDRPGRVWVEKMPDERQLSLVMWVVGCDEDGNVSEGQRGKFRENWETLKSMFGVYDRMIQVDRTIRIGSELRHRRAMIEVKGDMALQARGPSAGTFSVDCVMPDPFWYEAEEETLIWLQEPQLGVPWPVVWPAEWDTPSGLPPRGGEALATNIGAMPVEPFVKVFGPCERPRIEHVESGRFMEFDLTVPEDRVLEIDPVNGTVRLDGVSRYASMVRGSRWMKMDAQSTNTFRYEVGVGSGMVRMTWRPPFL